MGAGLIAAARFRITSDSGRPGSADGSADADSPERSRDAAAEAALVAALVRGDIAGDDLTLWEDLQEVVAHLMHVEEADPDADARGLAAAVLANEITSTLVMRPLQLLRELGGVGE